MSKKLKVLKEYLLITLGMIMVSAGVYYFLVADDVSGGGVSGLAIVINSIVPYIPVGLLMLVMNIFLFIIAFLLIGPSFGARTIYASLGVSGMIWAFEKFFPLKHPLSDNILLNVIFGILISGAGMGIVFNHNASTGGTDIIAKILNKFFHIGMGTGLIISDLVISLLATMRFGVARGMYSILAIIINGYVVDNIIEGLNVCKQVVIISKKREEIKSFIINELQRGVTVYRAVGAFSGEDKEVIMSIMSKKEFIMLREYIKDTDSRAFITVSNVHEVLGEGFKNIED